MFSVMYTGMNLLPLCTASVCPTKSGVMVLRRDHVLKTFSRSRVVQTRIFSSSCSSTYGPSSPNVPLLGRFPAATAAYDEFGRCFLLMTGLRTSGLPTASRRDDARALPLTAAQRMVDGVHGDATHARPPAEPAGLAAWRPTGARARRCRLADRGEALTRTMRISVERMRSVA